MPTIEVFHCSVVLKLKKSVLEGAKTDLVKELTLKPQGYTGLWE